MTESAPIMSMALSPDNSFILVNLASHTIHLWPVEPLLRLLDAKLSGHPAPGKQLRTCLRLPDTSHPTPGISALEIQGGKRHSLPCQTAICHKISTFQISRRYW